MLLIDVCDADPNPPFPPFHHAPHRRVIAEKLYGEREHARLAREAATHFLCRFARERVAHEGIVGAGGTNVPPLGDVLAQERVTCHEGVPRGSHVRPKLREKAWCSKSALHGARRANLEAVKNRDSVRRKGRVRDDAAEAVAGNPICFGEGVQVDEGGSPCPIGWEFVAREGRRCLGHEGCNWIGHPRGGRWRRRKEMVGTGGQKVAVRLVDDKSDAPIGAELGE
jgi:hypothetical protein